MSLLTDSHEEVIAAMTGLGATVYAYVPAVPVPPALVVMPAKTWVTTGLIGSRTFIEVAWKITAIIAPSKNDAATLDVENLMAAILAALPDGYQLVRVGAPSIVDLGGQGAAYRTEITIKAQWKEKP